jgi:hypothetical protein
MNRATGHPACPPKRGNSNSKEIKRLKCKVGELVLESYISKEAVKGRPFEQRTSDE